MPQGIDLAGIKVLVVDDDLNVRALLCRRFTDWGAEVTEAEAGPRGIVELKRARDAGKPFGLIFVDSTMSPMNGFEVADHIKDHPAEFQRTVMMLGPERVAEEISSAREHGVSTYVTKPLTRPAVIGAIASVLGDATRAHTPAPQPKPNGGPRILIAEDSADIGRILRAYLDRENLQVDVAQDGGIAVDLFRMVGYDLVLMDIQMPNFDGYWATREIRTWERENNLKRTPIIAVTAYPQEEDRQKTFRAGLDGYLVKPVDKETLVRVVRKYLKR